MDEAHIQSVRRFNRLATQRAGALEDHFLGRDRPLWESRVLFEVGAAGATLRDLRTRLGLDSGYLSRLVQSLAAKGLVEVEASDHDERVRHAVLTEAGLAELDEIDRRSDDLAATVLQPLTASQRTRLVSAMDDVHRLLTISAFSIEATDPADDAARWCLGRYFEELGDRFEEGFDPLQSASPDAMEFRPPNGVFLVGTVYGRPVACGAIKRVGPDTSYLKRMWADSGMRGLGLGRRMLAALEQASLDLGCPVVQLETNEVLGEAIQLYTSSGYREVPPFNDERYAHHWFEKRLDVTIRPADG